ncbi:MAG: LamG domain-containing protein, partial [Phycisphaerae bacterium]
MSKKLIYFTSFIVLLGLVDIGVIRGADLDTDPDLVAWWKLDEGQGTTAADSSGNGYDGTLVGDIEWLVPGMIGDAALEFTGDGQYVAIKDLFYQGTDYTEITVCVWIRTSSSGTQYIASFDRNEYWRLEVNGSGGGPGQIGWDVYHSGGQLDYGSVTRVDDGQWHHVAGVYDNGTATIYIDGEAEPSATGGPTWGRRENVRYGFIGANSEATEFDGSRGGGDPVEGNIDDLRIYHRALTQIELRELGGFLESFNPDPADGVKYLDTWAALSWMSGPRAVSHDVYIGDNFDDVNDGAESTFVGNLTGTFLSIGFPGMPFPDGLVPGTTYYWRIDDVDADGAKIKGKLWSFWIPPITAYDPVPVDGEVFEDPNVVLSWSPGMNATIHAVYFGTNADEVANAIGGPPHMETTYTPGLLTAETAYYWRVDTFNGAEWVTGPLWSFGTMPVIPVTDDPNLVAWWKLGEGAGTNALDWSGHGNHGKLFETQWSDSSWVSDSALDFTDDASYVAIKNMSYSDANSTEITVCSWIRTSDPNDQYIISFDRNEYWRLQVNGEVATEGQVGWHVWTSTGQVDYGSITRVDDGFWHHVCGVFDNGTSTIYIDGLPEPSAFGGNTFGSGDETRFGFLGANSEATEFNGNRGDGSGISGDVADVRIYNKALTQDEILTVMRVDPLMAWDLRPPSRTLDIMNVPSSLSWKAGDNASQHDVYFGTDLEAVSNADASDTSGVYRGRQTGTTYVPPDDFALGQSYLWRIDEFNTDGTITKGGVRAIIVPEFVTIDDFERYNDLNP